MYDLLLTGGTVVDPAQNLNEQIDLAVAGGSIAALAGELRRGQAHRIIDVRDKWILPGLIDTHVHLSRPFGGPQGYRMLAKAGVTCALDMAGYPEALVEDLQKAGTGLSVGFVYPLVPNETIDSPAPGQLELQRVTDEALKSGALGVKILGGHYPVSPDATAQIIRIAHSKHVWCAVHAGTTATGSNIEGLEELVDLADQLPIHIAHVNSYCRGQITNDPLEEASRALRALAKAPRARSESYLALINGADATIVDGVPKSHVVKTCLKMGGYPATSDGMEEAILAGWARIQQLRDGETVLLPPEPGLAHYRSCDTRVGISFSVNPASSAIALAIAKSADGSFVVTALSTDGGAIPRNTTLQQGLALVRFGALSLQELVIKACLNPARMLGVESKGHLRIGADADIVIVDPVTAAVECVVADGKIIVHKGEVVGQGGCLLTTGIGKDYLDQRGVKNKVVKPDWL